MMEMLGVIDTLGVTDAPGVTVRVGVIVGVGVIDGEIETLGLIEILGVTEILGVLLGVIDGDGGIHPVLLKQDAPGPLIDNQLLDPSQGWNESISRTGVVSIAAQTYCVCPGLIATAVTSIPSLPM